MTVKELAQKADFEIAVSADTEREICGAYVGDLLSWVMGRCEPGNLWITIISNLNVVAVSTLADASAIILAEGVTLDEEVMNIALQKGVNVISSPSTAYATAKDVAAIIE